MSDQFAWMKGPKTPYLGQKVWKQTWNLCPHAIQST